MRQVDSGTFFGPGYLQWPFAQDFYSYAPYLAQCTLSMLPASPWNECHFDNPAYVCLYNQANATLDPALRKEIAYQMQQIDYSQGGYIVPAFVAALAFTV